MLFCRGVPVTSSLELNFHWLSSLYSAASVFFNLWASSTSSALHLILLRVSASLSTISYVVISASNFLCLPGTGDLLGNSNCRMTSRLLLLPTYTSAFTSGIHLANSLAQFGTVDSGTTTSAGCPKF